MSNAEVNGNDQMNATENETIVQQILVPCHRVTVDYVYEQCDAARHARFEDGKRVKISPIKYFDNGDRLVHVAVSGRRTAGVPKIVLAEAEAQFRRAREVARVAVEAYREAREKVTELRNRRRAYEARQALEQTSEGSFDGFAHEQINKIAASLGLPAHILRDAQSSSGSGAARQVRDWARYRPDPAAGESIPPHEL